MSFLRSQWLIALISLVVLTAYAQNVWADCEPAEVAAQTDHHQDAPGHDCACDCVCHVSVTPKFPDAEIVVSHLLSSRLSFQIADEFPPDSLPLGIDHPPQLA